MLDLTLQFDGYAVVRAPNGVSGLRMLMMHPFDVVICDASMPVVSGWQLVGAMRDHPRLISLPVIMAIDPITAELGPSDPDVFEIVRPFQVGDLCELIHRVMKGRRRR